MFQYTGIYMSEELEGCSNIRNLFIKQINIYFLILLFTQPGFTLDNLLLMLKIKMQ